MVTGLMFSRLKLYIWLRGFLSGKALGRIPGVRTFDTLMYRKLVRPKGTVLTNVQGNRMYVNTQEWDTVLPLLIHGLLDKYETELFKKMITEGMVVVDIGANIGYYTLIAAKLVGESGIVYAFEPEPNNYELLCKNIEVNGYTNVVPVRKAVSNKQGKAKLWVRKSGSSDPSDPSLSKDNLLEGASFVEVETISLDEFFANTKNSKVDVMQIDAQGAEGLIVNGTEKILQSNSLKILMEFMPKGLRNLGTDPLEMLSKLQEYGFKIKRIRDEKQVLEPIEIIEFCRNVKPHQQFSLLLEK